MTTPNEIMNAVVQSVTNLAHHITTNDILAAVSMIVNCKGNIITTGIGKSGLVAQKIAATLSSTGTKAFYVHSTEAMHGDFGKIKHQDVVLAVSKSGSTAEVVEFIKRCRVIKLCKVILITAKPGSKMSCIATHTIYTNQDKEAGEIDVPSLSTICAMIVGDTIALCVAEEEECTEQEYRVNHPAGSK